MTQHCKSVLAKSKLIHKICGYVGPFTSSVQQNLTGYILLEPDPCANVLAVCDRTCAWHWVVRVVNSLVMRMGSDFDSALTGVLDSLLVLQIDWRCFRLHRLRFHWLTWCPQERQRKHLRTFLTQYIRRAVRSCTASHKAEKWSPLQYTQSNFSPLTNNADVVEWGCPLLLMPSNWPSFGYLNSVNDFFCLYFILNKLHQFLHLPHILGWCTCYL